MTIGDFCLWDNSSDIDTIKIRKYSPETGPRTVLEETPLNEVHRGWWKFEVNGFNVLPRDNLKVCIVAYIKEE